DYNGKGERRKTRHLAMTACASCEGALDDAPAQALIARVEHRVLTRRDRTLRLVEAYETAVFRAFPRLECHCAVLVGLAVAHLRAASKLRSWSGARDPSELPDLHLRREQCRMVVPLHDDERIARHVLVRNVPGLVASALA